MKNILSISIVFVLLFSMCKKQNELFYEFDFVAVDSFSFPLLDSTHNLPYDVQFVKTDTANLLFVYFKNDYLTIYNFDSLTFIKRIPLIKGKPIFSFNVVNLDSIFVFYNTGYFKRYNDTVFQIIDFNGKVKRTFGIFDKNFKTKLNDVDDIESQYYSYSLFYKFPIVKSKIFFSVSKLRQGPIGDSITRTQNLFSAAFIDLKTSKVKLLKFPNYLPSRGYYYPSGYNKSILSISHDSNILYFKPHTPDFFKYNVKTGYIEKYKLTSVLLDSIEPIKDTNLLVDIFYFPLYKGVFLEAVYSKNLNLYIRRINLPSKLYNHSKLFVVGDTNFNKLGEGLFPEGHSKMFFTSENIVCFNAYKTFASEGKIYFTVFNLKKKPITRDSFIKKFQKNNFVENCNTQKVSDNTNSIKSFLDNYIQKANYAVLIIPFTKSCPSCKQFALTYYSLNRDICARKDVYLLFDYSNVSAINAEIVKYNLNINNQHIILDTLVQYDNYVSTIFNPRVVIVCKDSVIYDKTYYPDELGQLDSIMFSYLQNQVCPRK